jgi:adenylate cyclase
MFGMRAKLRAFLRDAGASDDEIDRADTDGGLPLLVIDRLLMPGRAEYDLAALARESGLEQHLLLRLWRALGFPDVPADARVFTSRDLDATRALRERAQLDGVDPDALVAQVQVVSAAMARVASVEADVIAEMLLRWRSDGLTPDDIAQLVYDGFDWDDLAALIDYEHRLQLRAAIWRRLALDAAPDLAIGVGFADLAGYTRATAHLAPEEIAALVSRWEERAYDVVTEHGGRVVKTIGDEVMFIGLPRQVVDAAVSLRDHAAQDPDLLPVRAGLAAGPVVSHNGDFYGPVVNLASRLTDLATSGMVLATDDLRAQLDDDAIAWIPHGTHRLRGIGTVATWALERAG